MGGLTVPGLPAAEESRQQTKNDIDESGIDRQELLSWSIHTLMAAAGQAMQQKNLGAVVACIRQLDHMTGTGYNSTAVTASTGASTESLGSRPAELRISEA